MNESSGKDYIVVVQCDIVKQRCSGYLKTLIARLGIDVREDTAISELSEKRRAAGTYTRGAGA